MKNSNTINLNKNSNTVSISDCKKYVKNLLNESLPEHIHFHDWSHTKEAAKDAKAIAKELKLAKEEKEDLIIAVLFHDVGFTTTNKGHEDASIQMAQDYLIENNFPVDRIQRIGRLIEVTKENIEPRVLLEKAMQDAVLSYVGKKDYDNKLRDLMAEHLQLEEGKFLEMEWNETNIKFLKSHQFHTKAARKLFSRRKEKNLINLDDKLKKIERENSISENKAARMIFKTALRNHIDLTSIADQKSNIMLSINAVILTLGMPLFATYFVGRPELMIPAVIFLVTCAITMIIATIATRPVSTDGKTDLDKLFSGRTNLFFFGNFYKLKLGDYQESIDAILSDRKTLEKSIVNDLYYLGQALGEKFRMLRICYTVFAGGLIVTFIAFAISYFIYMI